MGCTGFGHLLTSCGHLLRSRTGYEWCSSFRRKHHAAHQGFSIELQATSPVPEWDRQKVRSAQEEDVMIDATGKVRWALRRQTAFHLVR